MNRRDTILVADDVEINRAVLRSIFEEDYNVLEAENGEQALFLMRQYRDSIAIVLLDLIMPVRDGYEVMEERQADPSLRGLPVAVITADDSVESEIRVFDLGASDIIGKPFEPHLVRRRIRNIVSLSQRHLDQDDCIREQARKLRESNAAVIDALSSIIEYRSAETGQHIKRIQLFTRVLLEDVAANCPDLGLDESRIAMIVSASSLHDIGKIAIPDAILNKPGRLTAEEFEVMKTHAVKGCEILSRLDRMGDRDYLKYASDICLYHHERWDGKGYPKGLKKDRIPMCAQVVGIADCYDALTTDRVYRGAIPPEHAFNMILNGECGAFSPRLLESFKNVRDSFRELTLRYADQELPQSELVEAEPLEDGREDGRDVGQLFQAKYLTLLGGIDATVMEVDFQTGLYHLEYLSDPVFDTLRSGRRFEDSVRLFAEQSVLPEDRPALLTFMTESMGGFLEQEQMGREIHFRVWERGAQGFRRCGCSMLRVDAGSLYCKKVLLVWKIEGEAQKGRDQAGPEAGAGAWNDLLGGTFLCLCDPHMTIRKLNDGFCRLLGYGEAEIREQFHSRYRNLIYPGDREEVLRQIREQLRVGNVVEMEYRAQGKDGSTVWLLDRGYLTVDDEGNSALFHMLVDVTRSKRAQEELRRMQERYQLILEQTEDIIVEWDIRKERLTVSDNWEKKFGYQPVQDGLMKQISMGSHIHPDDLAECAALQRDMAGGKPYGEKELRVADKDGRYRWCRVRAAAQMDEMGHPLRVVAVIADIGEEKRRSEFLQNRAERDGLTGFYNQTAGKLRARQLLEKQGCGRAAALYMIDMDNFREVNERYGHSFGNVVLQEISNRLRRLFSGGEVLIRVGGDEFLILAPGVEEAAARAQGREIQQALQDIIGRDVVRFRFSCSIGISLCPGDGEDFETLYRKGCRALLAAKERDTDKYVLYRDEPKIADEENEPAAGNTHIDTEDDGYDGLAREVFDALYGTGEAMKSLSRALELAGRRLGLSRVGVIQADGDGERCSLFSEWCKEGSVPLREAMQDVLVTRLGGWEQFGADGVFCCADAAEIGGETGTAGAVRGPGAEGEPGALGTAETAALELERTDARAVFRFAVRDSGGDRGWISFEDCLARREWTEEQRAQLAFAAGIISLFLLKMWA